MSRIVLLLIMSVWLLATEQLEQPRVGGRIGLYIFFAGFIVLVAGLAIWGRMVVRQLGSPRANLRLRYYHWAGHLARWAIPAWLAFGVLGPPLWGDVVALNFGTTFQLIPMLVGTAPALLTWVALWWAEYPAERALREESLLYDVQRGLPVYRVPSAATMLALNFRQQFLPIVLPVLMIILFRDAIILVLGDGLHPTLSEGILLVAALCVYLISPELMRILFGAMPLTSSPLRDRLEQLCRRAGLRYRDILVWRTDNTVANALVVGLLPSWRYVMLSDRLLETMDDRQIEAVFAHEMGHIVHRHMMWFIVFFLILVLGSLGPGRWLDAWVAAHLPQQAQLRSLAGMGYAVGALATTLLTIGWLSRRFERQADVYAARMMQLELSGAAPEISPLRGAVGPDGAEVFSSALRRVAEVNNLPTGAWGLFHPSIARRMLELEDLSFDASRTSRFDRVMRRLYWTLILALAAFGAAAVSGSM